LVQQVGPVKRAGDAAERAAHEDEGTDAIWVLAVVFEGDLNTHRVGGDDWPLDAKLVADASEVAGEVLDRQLLAVDGRPTPTMSAKMPVDDSVVAGESGSEIAPGKAVTADSISQNDGGLTLTELFVEEAGTICRVDKALAVVLHARGAYFLAESSGVSGISLTEGSFRISGRAIFTQRWTIHERERSNLADSCLMSCSIDSGK
jgi:hypothetical protein